MVSATMYFCYDHLLDACRLGHYAVGNRKRCRHFDSRWGDRCDRLAGGDEFARGRTEIVAKEKSAIPGFVDVHIHGAGGHDVMEGTIEALAVVTKTVARHGTTSIVATTVTASADDICRSSEGIAKYIATQHDSNEPRAEVLGIHFEGPFLSELRRGVHPAEWLRLPSMELLERFIAAAGGNARIITLAPELLGAMPCIDAAQKSRPGGGHRPYRCDI